MHNENSAADPDTADPAALVSLSAKLTAPVIGEPVDPARPVAAASAASAQRRDRRRGWWQWPALLVIAAIAAVAYAWDITTDGLEIFYAAGVRSMAGNWHDFLFGSFDPAGWLSLDKLPGPFWIQALSVWAFGASVWAMVLPQVVWSVLTVIVVFFMVRRVAGRAAGLSAAALLAISPVTFLSARGNLPDPLFVLLSVLAADAVLRAVGDSRLRCLMAAAVWLGLAFQAKMTEAWLVAAVLAVAYLVAGPVGIGTWRRIGRLAATAPVLAVVSLAWMVFVTLTPASDRPYVDGSEHNSVFAQIFGYNGLARFGDQTAYGLHYLARPSAASVAYSRQATKLAATAASQAHPGWDRLFTAPLAQLSAWLLVPALIIAIATLVATVRSWSREKAQATEVQEVRHEYAPHLVWGLWLIVFTVVFSVSSVVQSYYLGILSPAIAVLCALGMKAAADRSRVTSWRLALAAGVTVTGLCSAGVLWEAGQSWHTAALAAGAVSLIGGVAAAVLMTVTRPGKRNAGQPNPEELGLDQPSTEIHAAEQPNRGRAPVLLARICLSLAVVAALAGPLIADGWALAKHAGVFDTPLVAGGTAAAPSPAAVAASREHPVYAGTFLPETSAALWKELQQGGQEQNALIPPGQWLAVYDSPAASNFILGGAQRILPIGGFTGLVPSPTTSQLTTMIKNGQIRFAIIPGPGDTRYNDPRVQAIVNLCTPPPTSSTNIASATDTTAAPQLYDCSGG